MSNFRKINRTEHHCSLLNCLKSPSKALYQNTTVTSSTGFVNGVMQAGNKVVTVVYADKSVPNSYNTSMILHICDSSSGTPQSKIILASRTNAPLYTDFMPIVNTLLSELTRTAVVPTSIPFVGRNACPLM